jgi:hypothetical protein
MKARIALVAAAAAAVASVAAPSAAMAGPNDNNNASVAGVSAGNPNDGCGVGYFCLYTGPTYTGRVFRLFHCQTYSLANWNGVGSWINNNSGGAHAQIQGQSHNTITDTDPVNNWFNGSYDMKPAWYVKAC